MTITDAKARLVAWANAQVGTREGDNNWNRYAENTDLEKLYGWKPQNEPWCDAFVDAGFIECFGLELASRLTYQPIGKGSAACKRSAGFYSAAEAFYDVPQVGDQVFFYVGGGINHTGIVTQVAMGAITTVEGNSSDMVARRTYAVNAPQIAGYGRPNWNVVSAAPDILPEKPAEAPDAPAEKIWSYSGYTYSVKVNLLKRGSYGPQVKHMQQLLHDNGFDCSGVDGVFGDQTYDALRAFQKAAGISVDGEWGGESFAAMWNY